MRLICDEPIINRRKPGYPGKTTVSLQVTGKLIGFLHITLYIPMTLYEDIRLYFITYIHIYCCNLNNLLSLLKNWTTKNFKIVPTLDTQILAKTLDPNPTS